jgi:sulfite oxidase
LESYRIGNLDPKEEKQVMSLDNPFKDDPKRHPALLAYSIQPYNGEPPMMLLADNFNTPNNLFFIRNHFPVPDVDLKTYKLVLRSDKNPKIIEFTLDDLKKMEATTISGL